MVQKMKTELQKIKYSSHIIASSKGTYFCQKMLIFCKNNAGIIKVFLKKHMCVPTYQFQVSFIFYIIFICTFLYSFLYVRLSSSRRRRWYDKNSIFELKHGFFKSYLFAAAVIEWSRVNLNLFYLLNSSLCKVDLHLTYKKPIHVNNNVAHISVNKLPNNIDNNETKYVMVIR